MQHEQLRVEVDGAELTGLPADLLELEVELDDQLAGMFRLTLALCMQPDGSWPYLDDQRLALWQEVGITGGPQDGVQHLITGYVTHLRPGFGSDLDRCRLEVWGLDATVLMDRTDQLRAWPNKTDSDIATEVLDSYGLASDVTSTDIVHDEKTSTVIQRETDIQLLRRLAFRNGFSCYVDGDTVHFGPPPLDGKLPALAVQFGPQTNVERFKLEVNGLKPVDVTMTQTDRLTGDVLGTQGRAEQQRALGKMTPEDLGRVQVGQAVTTGEQEMAALCQSLYDEGQWFVTGEGEVLGNAYPGVLVPHALVPIKGIGATHSGLYEVTHVTHVFTSAGYRQRFRVRRNATEPTGEEDFG
ncbi:contractile injection system protein, VgrG/Pvc8 family [Streptomyces bobili]|uniref:phage late control D family protein n=1 Tax=Streptomyces bobili TaxID=67280 RepID=UPI00344A497A